MSIDSVLANETRWHVENCHCMAGLALLPDQCLHMICSSPPYWGLRDYQIPPSIWGGRPECDHQWASEGVIFRGQAEADLLAPGQNGRNGEKSSASCIRCGAWLGCYGDEPTLDLYIEHTVLILQECYRVLRDDGQLWWNLGDSYGNDSKWGGSTSGAHAAGLHGQPVGRRKRQSNAADLSKLLIPHQVAIAAARAGWIVRQDIVWAKASPMPESVGGTRWAKCRHKIHSKKRHPGKGGQDRGQPPQGSTLTRAGRDNPEEHGAKWRDCTGCPRCVEGPGGLRMRLKRGSWRPTTSHEYIFQLVKQGKYFGDGEAVKEKAAGEQCGNKDAGKMAEAGNDRIARLAGGLPGLEGVSRRNMRSVMTLSHEPLKLKHFAAFPSAIPRKAINASTSAKGVCPTCGEQWAPIVDKLRVPTRPGRNAKEDTTPAGSDAKPNRDDRRHISISKVLGWRPTCACPAADAVPAIVADIFSGTGTTGRVAYATGRRYIGFEISPRYVELSRERIVKPFTKRKPVPKHKRPMSDQKSLFEH